MPTPHPDRYVPATKRVILARPEWTELRTVASFLRTETTGGALLLAATAVALVMANSPLSGAYESIIGFVPLPGAEPAVGPLSFHLDLDVATWAADGLLAIFFFVVGVELIRELRAGALRNPARAALPIVAAVGGVIVPALIYVAIASADPEASVRGWAIPVATDIAFALAVLAVLSSHLPGALRVFLLTLAVVDDMIAVTIIAIFFTADPQPLYLLASVVPLVAFAVLIRRGVTTGWVLVPLAVLTWLLVHESGVHATIAGVVLGLLVPVAAPGSGRPCRASSFEHRWRPVSAGVAVPVFAFTAAGLDLREGGIGQVFTDATALAVFVALVVGKPIGVMSSAWLLARLTRAELDEDIGWADVAGIAVLSGLGFTVSLLIAELAYGDDPELVDAVRGAVLLAAVASTLLAAAVLLLRNRHYRRVEERETRDTDADGVPDVYEVAGDRGGSGQGPQRADDAARDPEDGR